MNNELRTLFGFNEITMKLNMSDITQAESLRYPEKGGNCINWILGHIVLTRDLILEMTGNKKLCSEESQKKYKKGSVVINTNEAEEITELLNKYNLSQEILLKTLNEKDFSLEKEVNENLTGLGFHEAYHLGQIGILRRMTGRKSLIG